MPQRTKLNRHASGAPGRKTMASSVTQRAARSIGENSVQRKVPDFGECNSRMGTGSLHQEASQAAATVSKPSELLKSASRRNNYPQLVVTAPLVCIESNTTNRGIARSEN